ncbi:Peptidase M14 carboxypeptidase A domain-containing protein [Plasmodiophora brassicae]|uniref:Succinylglutamate desuccinylase/Aspartoacylase catalytic domain-containing protein n=1 Tax=Plasmodiophora brassicae TaxID=37360 RepID=A0A3P3YDZ7_PLABS|nr:unnamed protein product [Plasmodiophora brassicae]
MRSAALVLVVVVVVVIAAGHNDVVDARAAYATRSVADLADLRALPGTTIRFLLNVAGDGLGRDVQVPVIVVRGAQQGPRVCLSAAMHGDEVTGVGVLFRLVERVEPGHLHGTLIIMPVLNPDGFRLRRRGNAYGKDLNRAFASPPVQASLYAQRLLEALSRLGVTHHVDLHTASKGYTNAFYARVDMRSPASTRVAFDLAPDIVVNNTGPANSFRRAATAMGIAAVTVEMGGPDRVHARLVPVAGRAVDRLLTSMGMLSPGNAPNGTAAQTYTCGSSAWVYSRHGGLVRVFPGVNTRVRQGQILAEVRDLFGAVVDRHHAEHDAVVIGKVTELPCPEACRMIHLGRLL